MPEKSNPLDQVHEKNIFPAPEGVREDLEWQARQNPEHKQFEIRALDTVSLKGESEITRYQFARERMLQAKTKPLSKEGVVVTEEDGTYLKLEYTPPKHEKIVINFPEVYLTGLGGKHYQDTKEEFKGNWAKLPENFRKSYEEYIDWARINGHTGVELDVLQGMNKIDPFEAEKIRRLNKNPEIVVLGKVNIGANEKQFYWAAIAKNQQENKTIPKKKK